MSKAKVVFLGDSVHCSGVPQKVFGVLAILGQQEPGMPLMDSFIFVLESISDEFDGDVSFVLGRIFHPISSVFWGRFDKVRLPCYVTEEVWFLSAVYDEVGGNLVAEVDWYCCQVCGGKPDLCNALAGIKARCWWLRSLSCVRCVTCGWQQRGGRAPYSAILLSTSTTRYDPRWSSKLARSNVTYARRSAQRQR